MAERKTEQQPAHPAALAFARALARRDAQAMMDEALAKASPLKPDEARKG